MRFRGMDANRDGVITRAEWRGNDRSFANHDWDGDGVLSGPEVAPGLIRPDDFDLDRSYFGHLDRNDDGFLSPSELPGGEAGFRGVDRDHDGRVSRQEHFAIERASREDRFRDLDHDGDRLLSLEEWHGDRDVFNRLDRDWDGMLSSTEFLNPEVLSQRDQYRENDANRDGRITRAEWQGKEAAFRLLDFDGDGVVSRDEFRLERFRGYDNDQDGTISRSEWPMDDESFTRRDANRDGRISREEFIRY